MALGISEAVEISGRVLDLVKKGVTMGLQEEVMNLREAVLNGRAENLKLRQENHELLEKLAAEDAAKTKAREYELTKTWGGAYVFESKVGPKHYACPNCFEERRISILQRVNAFSGRQRCPNCKNEFPVDQPASRPPPRVIT